MVIQQILKKIRRKGRGYVFTPKDFLNLGSRAAVDQAVARLARSGKIRRLRRGLYDYPRVSPRLGVLSASPDGVAHAMARRTNGKLLPSGAQAANAFGLSTQVPARPVFITDGPTKRVQVGSQTVLLRHASPRFFLKDRDAALAVQAIRYLGSASLDQTAIGKLSKALSPRSRAAL